MSKVGVSRLHRSSEARYDCTVVEAAHRFTKNWPVLGRGLVEWQSAKLMLGLLVTQNPERFEPRDVAAWEAYLSGHP